MQYSGRRFISKEGDEGGNVRWNISTGEDSLFFIEGNLHIADCNRSITLDFSVYTGVTLDGRIAKLDELIDELYLFREKLVTLERKPKPKIYLY